MPVYVDSVFIPFRRMKMCHMIADTPEELHDMARRIGMQRRWYQHPGVASFPHYDIAKGRRAQAIGLGAVILERRRYVAKMDEIKADTKFREIW